MEKAKKSKGGRIFAIIAFALLAIVIIAVVAGGDEKEPESANKRTKKEIEESFNVAYQNIQKRLTTDSLSLVQYFKGKLELPEGMSVFVDSFDQLNIYIVVTLPDSQAKDDSHLNELGEIMCKYLIDWMTANEYDIESYGAHCIVAGTYTGVTGKQGYTIYGVSTYDPHSDTIKWEWK